MKNILVLAMTLMATLLYHGLFASYSPKIGRYFGDQINCSEIRQLALDIAGQDQELAKLFFRDLNNSRHYKNFVLQVMAQNILVVKCAVQRTMTPESAEPTLAIINASSDRLRCEKFSYNVDLYNNPLQGPFTKEQQFAIDAEQAAWNKQLVGLEQR
jgi:hypothetical protein